jgi:hypothetical protein
MPCHAHSRSQAQTSFHSQAMQHAAHHPSPGTRN